MKSPSLVLALVSCSTTFQVRKSVLSIALLVLATNVFGQGVTGTILGTVEDSNHAVITTASVTVTNQATNQSATVPTGGQGNYIAASLPPGTYRVSVKAQGFREAVSADNVLVVNGTKRVDLGIIEDSFIRSM